MRCQKNSFFLHCKKGRVRTQYQEILESSYSMLSSFQVPCSLRSEFTLLFEDVLHLQRRMCSPVSHLLGRDAKKSNCKPIFHAMIGMHSMCLLIWFSAFETTQKHNVSLIEHTLHAQDSLRTPSACNHIQNWKRSLHRSGRSFTICTLSGPPCLATCTVCILK